jgi:formylglycine-generating enzyme required for sulfatase activity
MRHVIQLSAGSVVGAFAAAVILSLPSAPSSGADEKAGVPDGNHKRYAETLADDVRFEMVPIPGGTFLMGSPPNEPGRSPDEGPQHPVTIRPFWMGKTEVTWDEYDIYRKERAVEEPEENEKRLKENPVAVTGPTRPYTDETFAHGREKHPAMCITHHATMEYCRWLSQKTGRTYRLPTEAEWEYAARAGTTTAYFFGNDPKQLGDYAWYKANCPDEVTREVGTKKPNPWGVCDIYGNLAEWCLDTYKSDYYATFATGKPALSPVLIPGPDRFSHVARGGSWEDDPTKLRSAARRASDKKWIKRDPQRPQSIWWLTDAQFVGFRVVRPVKEQENLKGLRSLTTRESK